MIHSNVGHPYIRICFDLIDHGEFNGDVGRVRYKVTVFPDPKKKVSVSESYRFYVVESYRCPEVTVFGEEVTVFCQKVTVFSDKVTVVMKATVLVKSYRLWMKLPFYREVTVFKQKVTVSR